MAAPEERELTAEQTEKLLQFQVQRRGGPCQPAGAEAAAGGHGTGRVGSPPPAGAGVLPACAGPWGMGLTESRDRPRLERARQCGGVRPGLSGGREERVPWSRCRRGQGCSQRGRVKLLVGLGLPGLRTLPGWGLAEGTAGAMRARSASLRMVFCHR